MRGMWKTLADKLLWDQRSLIEGLKELDIPIANHTNVMGFAGHYTSFVKTEVTTAEETCSRAG
jgi:hypothetical protein